MSCYLCNSDSFHLRKGAVRDAPEMRIVECDGCGLVSLSQTDHIASDFYENSGMHGEALVPMDAWLRASEWDDRRRFEMVKSMLPNKRVLDFGCGAGGFLQKAQTLAAEVTGIELEARVRDHWAGRVNILSSVEAAAAGNGGYDLITAFHVVEHLADPRSMLKSLASLLRPKGRLIVEVPHSEDALLTLYSCDAFQRFTYWSQHLFLFNASTLKHLACQAGLNVVAIQHYQRYPLSNHLYWLSQGLPGGHQHWSFLDTPEISQAYAHSLAALGKTDTLIAHLELGR